MTGVDPADLVRWRDSIGRTERRSEILSTENLRRFALAVGADSAVEKRFPPLGHWAFFLPAAGDREIGRDGHPKRGGFLPDINLPRRMFAASEVRFLADLALETSADLVVEIVDVVHKHGSSGPLVLVEISRTIRQHGRERIVERQTIVFARADGGIELPKPTEGPPQDDDETWTPERVNLFRFSAATFNSHRIHYDEPYARGAEGYPTLLVQGPFVAAKLAGLAMRAGEIASFRYRAAAPLFVEQPIVLKETAPGEFRAIRCDGAVAAVVRAAYR